jgi:glycosyltransferase involved in cell wall biosynthesis
MHKLSIVIPAFNEEARIESTLREYADYFNKHCSNVEILVVTDGCTDRTPGIVDDLSTQYKCIKHIHPPCRLGKGGAVIQGFKAATGDMIGFLDGDGSTAPFDVLNLLKFLENYDGVIASRWIEGANINRHEPPVRVVASRSFNILVRLLFGLPFKDTQCGAKFFRSSAIGGVIGELGLTDWSFDIDLLYRLRKKGYKIKEAPITWEYKEGSKLDFKSISIKMLVSVLGFRVKTSPLGPLVPHQIADFIYRILRY